MRNKNLRSFIRLLAQKKTSVQEVLKRRFQSDLLLQNKFSIDVGRYLDFFKINFW